MRLLSLIILGLMAWEGKAAWAMTAKEKTLFTIGGGCAAGAGVGLYLDSTDKDPRKSTQGTVAASALIGCASSAVFSWLFMDDDQFAADRLADHLEEQLADMQKAVRTSDYRPSGHAQLLDFLKLEENFTGPAALAQMVDPGCEQWRFSLAFDGKSLDDLYIPVSRDVIIRNVEFLVVAPKPGMSPDTICVKPNYPFGYLNLELPGLDSLLYKRGEAAAKRAKKGSK